MSLRLKLEAEPGSSIDRCFIKACALANQLNIDVEFKFNGVTCIALINGNPETGIDTYRIKVNSKVPISSSKTMTLDNLKATGIYHIILNAMWNTEVKPCNKDRVFLQWLQKALEYRDKEVYNQAIDNCIEIVKKYRRFDNEEELQELENLKKKA